MAFPNVAGKHGYDAITTPAAAVEDLRGRGFAPDLSAVTGVVFCYQNSLMRHVLASYPGERVPGLIGECYLLDEPAEAVTADASGGRIGVCGGFGIGAPAATVLLEVLIAHGVRRFVSIGTAGALQRTASIGDLVLCTEAIRDEGVSYHYLAPGEPARPAPALTARLKQELERHGSIWTGPSWTIDAPFRETVEEAQHYQEQGVETVEMEAAALFAVAARRGVEVASAFVVSDSLAELTWSRGFGTPAVARGLEILFAAARAALLGGGEG